MELKEFLTGSGTIWGKDAYNQAVTEGMIDPSEVSLQDFMTGSNHEVIDALDDSYIDEAGEAARNVGHVVRGTDQGHSIVARWFGKSSK